jgi:flagellar motor switch protein FliG
MSASDERVNGAKIAAEILNRMSAENKDRILKAIRERSPEVAAQVDANLVHFDQILDITAQGLQLLLQSISQPDLVLSLKTASGEVKEILFKNMSDRKRKQVQEEFDLLPPIRISEVEGAQRRILDKLTELRGAGLIKTDGKDGIWV